ncbi:hypothetical protein [uncultured Clostridium sp.]|uniref:hypothetical protein n=1 Tax=uncultured Clostridium sp. TaxID=59620 RepID=UPI0026164817|nr:hypothetical protein [uncultured Clostridium sp.]
MNFSVGDIVMFLILFGVSLFSIVKYYKSKKQKYILFLLICIYGLFNRNNMIYITGIEINNTIYIEIFRFVLVITIVAFGYNLYKKKKLF